MKGFDCTQDMTAHGQQIIDGGYTFCARYYFSGISHAKTKLSRAEALHLSSMGIFLVAVFENAGDHAGYFTRDQGDRDGQSAFAYASFDIDQPVKTPIYFAVDFDASLQDLNRHIIPYFQGLRVHQGGYAVGVYGSGFVCRRLRELGLVSYTWLAQSPGWSEYHKYRDSKAWSILQGMAIKFYGLSIDPDESNGNGGGWKVEI